MSEKPNLVSPVEKPDSGVVENPQKREDITVLMGLADVPKDEFQERLQNMKNDELENLVFAIGNNYVRRTIANDVQKFLKDSIKQNTTVRNYFEDIEELEGEIKNLEIELNALRTDIPNLLDEPEKLAKTVKEIFKIQNKIDSRKEQIKTLKSLIKKKTPIEHKTITHLSKTKSRLNNIMDELAREVINQRGYNVSEFTTTIMDYVMSKPSKNDNTDNTENTDNSTDN